ncbi:hypothetical protein [Kitasatospora sp. SolWspMP-SS2h]|uniref:hypothetical protein n=1 Tax=Kitasatospora sp. SolWspMP-SS2h TaxID=1305729 RepID=UPI0018F3BCA2|nr:hypothetical protein [Kitasatospora sp. SolWspMP-SS2h]
MRFHRSEGVEVEALRRLDWVGRSQLPVDSAGVSRRSRRVRSAWEEDHIAVWRAEEEVHG